MGKSGAIRVGVGGWTYEAWRGAFFPDGLPHKRELEFASQALTAIEINGTYYGSQKPESFARWRDATPDGFVFSVKGPRFATNKKALAAAGPSIERFISSGVLQLGDKLGPINWQFLPTKSFEAEDFESFLKLLPPESGGRTLQHVVEVRHASFVDPAFVALLKRYGVAVVVTDSAKFPQIHDVTAPFVYARLQGASEAIETGYTPDDIGLWASRGRTWAAGRCPDDLPRIGPKSRSAAKPRDVFIFMINGFKPKAPAAALELLRQLG